MIEITECPRDAMQGIHHFIPTQEKIKYLSALIEVGFPVIDCGSFVSPKSIPQMADTKEVISSVKDKKSSELLVIVANERGASEAVNFDEVDYLGFPLSISETFQKRNTNKTIAEALIDVEIIQNLCIQKNKKLTVYISMGFGNPYGDVWNTEIINEYFSKLKSLGINNIRIADTVGSANENDIQLVFKEATTNYPGITIGAHFHSTPDKSKLKIQTAYNSGCTRFDSALLGFGGCPMAKDDLTGNIDTDSIIGYFDSINLPMDLNREALTNARAIATTIFSKYH